VGSKEFVKHLCRRIPQRPQLKQWLENRSANGRARRESRRPSGIPKLAQIGQVGLGNYLRFQQGQSVEPLTPVMADAMKEDLEQPGAAIGSRFEPVKRLPGLEIDFLNHIFRMSTVTHHTNGGTKDIIEIRHCLRFEPVGSGRVCSQVL
jgi:hypothetical protein